MPHATEHIAQGELHRRVHDPLRGYLVRLGASEAEADDLVADTFEVAIKKWSSRQPGKEVGWVYGIARNKLLDHRKKRGRFHRSLVTGVFPIEAQASVDEQYEASEKFSELTAAEQEVVHLIHVAGLSPDEVAELLGKTVSAVYERLRAARTRLEKEDLDVA